MHTFDLDGTENESDSLSVITVTAPYTDGGGNHFALGCFTGPTGCQSSQTAVTVGAHVLFISCWCGFGACG